MAFLAKVFYSGTGVQTDFTITFDHQQNVDVVVTVDGVVQVEDTDYSISGTTLTFLAGSIPASGVNNIEIRRATPTVPRVNFSNSGIITEAKLDKQNLQNSFIVEETKDQLDSKLGLDASDLYDAESTRIINVDDPTAAQDAATKSYVDAVATGTLPGPLPIAQGGTEAATAAAARTNLDVYSKAEADVPSSQVTAAIADAVDDLSGVTDPSGARVNIDAQQDVVTTRGDLVRGGSAGAAERLPLGTAGQFLTSDGVDALWGSGSGLSGLASVQVFTLTGTWNRPAGVTKCIIEVIGGGGGGGSADNTGSGQGSSGGGGGSGGYAKKLLDVTSIASSTITVGAGGVGGDAAVANVGVTGGDSSWADGTNTITGSGGVGGEGSIAAINVVHRGGLGGAATGGDINTRGNIGGMGVSIAGTGKGGEGAGSVLGGGGPGGAPNNAGGAADPSSGGGGGGANAGVSAAGRDGGDGADGIVIVWEYK